MIPVACPRCHKSLYTAASSRPAPSYGIRARLILIFAVLLSSGVFWISSYAFRELIPIWLPTYVVTAIALAPSLAPGVMLGIYAERLPKYQRLKCWNCHWSDRFPL